MADGGTALERGWVKPVQGWSGAGEAGQGDGGGGGEQQMTECHFRFSSANPVCGRVENPGCMAQLLYFV